MFNKSIRNSISLTLAQMRKFSKGKEKLPDLRLRLLDLDLTWKSIEVNSSACCKRLNEVFGKELSLAQLNIITIGMLSSAIRGSIETNKVLSWNIHEGVEPNEVISNLLVQTFDYSLSIINLLGNGQDVPAYTLMRSLQELCWIILTISYDRERMEQYCKLKDSEKPEEIWYKYFRPVKLKNSLKKLEEILEFPEDLMLELHSKRERSYRIYSNFSHHRYQGSLITSLERSDLFFTSRDVSDKTFKILDSLNYNLWYLIQALIKIFGEIHNWQDIEYSELWLITITLKECASKTFFVLYEEEMEIARGKVT